MTGILIHRGFLDESCQTTTEQLLKADTSFDHERCFLVSR